MEALRVALEHTSAEGLDLKTISAGIEIPGDEVDRFLDSFFAGESWDDWLARFGAHCPIHPTSGQVERFVDELMPAHPAPIPGHRHRAFGGPRHPPEGPAHHR